MTAQMVLTIGHDALTLLLMVAMPMLGTIMAVGLTVSVFQAVTQIHEATLAFVPKMVAALAVFARMQLKISHPLTGIFRRSPPWPMHLYPSNGLPPS